MNTQEQNEMRESIEYASLIQAALLPPTHQMESLLGDHFIIYLPRDIVSGDFYWVFPVDDWVYFATGDCTGHGVPGALMSILGLTFLNEVLSGREFIRPNRILNLLREKVMRAMHQTGDRNESQDGMDISLIAFNRKTYELQFSGANSFIHYIRNGEIGQLKGDRMPIGISGTEEVSFSNKTMKMKKGDQIYMFSDGYVDQFGGEKGKKYKYGKLEKTLLRLHKRGMRTQKELLIAEYSDWKGEYEQVDDVVLMGLRV